MPRAKNVVVGALAGTGKTTTMAETFRRAAGERSRIVGSEEQEEIWKNTKCENAKYRGMMAFNASVKDEWKSMQIDGLKVYSTFGFGLMVLKQNGLKANFDADKTEKLLEAINPKLNNKQVFPIKKLTELARLTLTPNDYEQLDLLAVDNCIQINEQGIDYVQDLLEQHESNTDVIDFADEVWLPHVLGKKIRPFDFLGVDECQDLNKAQQSLILNHANRLMLVGDERQAIYQFAGADEQSYGNLKTHLEGRPLGVMELPLTVSRRCSKAATRLAQQIVPEFKCLPDAREGSYRELEYVNWLCDVLPKLTPDHMVIARKNAPIVAATLGLLRRRIPAKMLGRQFGTDVAFHIRGFASGTNDAQIVKRKIEAALAQQIMKWASQKYVSEKAKENYFDIATSAIVFCDMCTSVEEVYTTISSMFADVKENPRNVVRLSSIHRAKGLEARHIHFLEHDVTGLPKVTKGKTIEPRQSDVNLRYIAITRTQEFLTLVKAVPEKKD